LVWFGLVLGLVGTAEAGNNNKNTSANHEHAPPAIDPATTALKQRIASEVTSDFRKHGVSLQGKSVLDVGSGLGFNAKAMEHAGATVIGIEPDSAAREKSILGM